VIHNIVFINHSVKAVVFLCIGVTCLCITYNGNDGGEDMLVIAIVQLFQIGDDIDDSTVKLHIGKPRQIIQRNPKSLGEHTQRINNGSEQRIAQNTYDALGQLKQKGVGDTAGGAALQTVNYGYNIRGWLRSINDVNNLGSDLWGMKISYNDPTNFGGNENPQALFNGNISQVQWNTASTNTSGNPVSGRYSLGYDALNRITSAHDNTGNYDVSNITYDKMGNLQSLTRNGWQNGSNFVNMDVLGYDYQSNSNKLSKVTDTGNRDYGFKEPVTSGDDYRYDPNGNLVMDRNKGIGTATVDGIEYNHLNLPVKVTVTGSNAGTIDYVYDTTGTKLKKTVSTGAVTEYAGSYVYSGNQSSTDLQFFAHPEGYVNVENNGYRYIYQYKDHLGNVRLSYAEDPSNPGSPTIIEENNFYPFGLKMRGFNNGGIPPWAMMWHSNGSLAAGSTMNHLVLKVMILVVVTICPI